MADFGITEGLAAISALTAGESATAAVTAGGGLYGALAPAAFAEALPSLSTIGTAASIAGTGLSAISGIQNADYQSAVARADAAAKQQKANEETAAAQRQQITSERQTDLVLSRARALAADSGTDATSPDILTTEGRIAQQGKYNALSSLYEGQARARTDSFQADIDLFKASRIGAAAPLTATGTILSGIGSFADRKLRRGYLLDQFGASA